MHHAIAQLSPPSTRQSLSPDLAGVVMNIINNTTLDVEGFAAINNILDAAEAEHTRRRAPP